MKKKITTKVLWVACMAWGMAAVGASEHKHLIQVSSLSQEVIVERTSPNGVLVSAPRHSEMAPPHKPKKSNVSSTFSSPKNIKIARKQKDVTEHFPNFGTMTPGTKLQEEEQMKKHLENLSYSMTMSRNRGSKQQDRRHHTRSLHGHPRPMHNIPQSTPDPYQVTRLQTAPTSGTSHYYHSHHGRQHKSDPHINDHLTHMFPNMQPGHYASQQRKSPSPEPSKTDKSVSPSIHRTRGFSSQEDERVHHNTSNNKKRRAHSDQRPKHYKFSIKKKKKRKTKRTKQKHRPPLKNHGFIAAFSICVIMIVVLLRWFYSQPAPARQQISICYVIDPSVDDRRHGIPYPRPTTYRKNKGRIR